MFRLGLSRALSRNVDRKLAYFRTTLSDPDHVAISRTAALKKYKLNRYDILRIPRLPKETYRLPDVVRLARQKYSDDELIRSYSKYLATQDTEDFNDRVFIHRSRWRPTRWYMTPSSQTLEGQYSIYAGLLSNGVLLACKIGVWLATHSPAIFADMMHTGADVVNYLYRLLGLRKSMGVGDQKHPYGYSTLRYITADRSFVILLLLGGIIPFVNGIFEIFQPVAALHEHALGISLGMFAFSAFLELASATAARKELEPDFKWRSLLRTPTFKGDVLSLATFLESRAGFVGGTLGFMSTLVTHGLVPGLVLPTCDAWASVLMSCVVSGTAVNLLNRSGEKLLGRSLSFERVAALISRIEEEDTVEAIYDVKSKFLGSEVCWFKAEIALNAEAISKKRGEPSDDLLREMKAASSSKDLSEDWLMKRSSVFLQYTSEEIKRLEAVIKQELSDFRTTHIDLELW